MPAYKPTVKRVKGLHKTAIKEGAISVMDYEPTVDRIVGLSELMKPSRRVVWNERSKLVRNAVNKIIAMRDGEIALKISQIPEMEAMKFSPRAVRASLFLLKDLSQREMKQLIVEISKRLFCSTKGMREIAAELSVNVEKKLNHPVSLIEVVWLVNSLVAARLPEHAVRHIKASPQLQGIIFKEFDRHGPSISHELQLRFGLSFRTMKTLRDRWKAWNRGAPNILKMELGRSPESFARITWKLANYGFHGAEQRIQLEEALEGEPISYQVLRRYKKEIEANIDIAKKSREWEKLEKRGKVPDLRKRSGFSEGFSKMLKFHKISPSKNPRAVNKLKKEVKAILAELDWSTRSFPQIASSLGCSENYVRLVNTAFNARPPQGIPNRMRHFIERMEKNGFGARRIAPRLSLICTEKTGRKTSISEPTIQKTLTRIKRAKN